MQSRRDPLDPSYRPEPEGAPSPRPPQFNGSYCGYRCGYGCCEPRGGDSDSDGDGGSSDNNSESGKTTLIGNEDQNTLMMTTPFQRNYVVTGTPRPEGLLVLGEIERQTGLVILANEFDDVVVVTPNNTSNRLLRIQSYEEMMNSLLPELSSGYLSMRTSNGRSRGIPSPMSPGLDIPTWVDDGQISLLPPEYHFLHPPLRLSPQDALTPRQSSAISAEQDADSLWLFLEGVRRQRATRNGNLF